MKSQHNICLLLGAFYICITLATVDPNTHMKKPYGTRTCQRLCIRITQCSCYLYLSYGTTCLPRIIARNQENQEMDRRKIQSEKVLNCSQGRGTSYTKERFIQCRPSLGRLFPFNKKEEWREGEMAKLLILPHTTSSQERQLFMHNNTVVLYPFIRVTNVLAVAYISSLRKIVVATWLPKELFVTPLYQSKKDIVKKGMNVRGLAVDDKNSLVFMVTEIPNRSVSMMTTEGKNYTLLRHTTCHPTQIAADRTRSLLYVLCGKYILLFTYQGVSKGAITVNSHPYLSISLDLESDSLYLTQEKNNNKFLIQMSLSDHSVTNLATFEKRVVEIVAIYNTVYVSQMGTLYILAINVSDPNRVTNISAGHNAGIVRMCAIP